MAKQTLIMLLICLVSFSSYSQEMIEDGEKQILQKNEYAFGVTLQSAGILAFNYRKGVQKTVSLKNYWEVELANLQHPKEFSDPRFENFIFKPGKINTVWTLRATYGQQKELSEKVFAGVALNWVYFGGASVAISKPIYVSVTHLHPHIPSEAHGAVVERYNPLEHSIGNIQNKEGFLTGIGEAKFYPGIFIKTGLNFEYSQYKSNIRAVEVGVSSGYYFKELPIMSSISNDNSNLKFGLYVNFLFGEKW
jgi:hypothetical protein